MRKVAGYFAGHIESSVCEAVLCIVTDLAEFPWALVTSIDSSTDLRQWKAFGKVVQCREYVGTALLISASNVVEFAKAGAFSGFDEVWFLRGRPTESPPQGVFLVGPCDVATDDVNPAIAWMKAQGCGLGLGDGIGLNFIAEAESTATEIEQPRASALPRE
jgi:hypothetical protein